MFANTPTKELQTWLAYGEIMSAKCAGNICMSVEVDKDCCSEIEVKYKVLLDEKILGSQTEVNRMSKVNYFSMHSTEHKIVA